MIRITLALLITAFISFSAGRTYEYYQTRHDRAITAEVGKITAMLDMLPVRGIK